MSVKQVKYGFLRMLGQMSLFSVVNFLCKTLKAEIKNEEALKKYLNENKNIIVAFWHGTMLYPWFHHRNKNMLGLTSYSKDGDLLAKILKKWNYTVLRGSSSKGGDVALGIMVDYAKNEGSVTITPDGPRGPKNHFKAGAVVAAKKSDVPLFLLGTAYSKKIVLNSWDSFEVPLPFSKVRLLYSEPIIVDSELSYEATSELIKECGEKLAQLQAEAERL